MLPRWLVASHHLLLVAKAYMLPIVFLAEFGNGLPVKVAGSCWFILVSLITTYLSGQVVVLKWQVTFKDAPLCKPGYGLHHARERAYLWLVTVVHEIWGSSLGEEGWVTACHSLTAQNRVLIRRTPLVDFSTEPPEDLDEG